MNTEYACNMVDTYGVVELRDWVARERAAGRLPANETVTVKVVHRDREAEGSCRWCGVRQTETYVYEPV